jgi:8-oxo-dGTP diphosphatase
VIILLSCGKPTAERPVMPTREIAVAIVIDTKARYLFQRRDNIPGILHPGKVSLFGGHREPGESYLDCIVREVHEEIGYLASREGIEHLTTLDELAEVVNGDLVRGDVFVLRNVPSEHLVVTEGSLAIVDPDKIHELESEFTPATGFALRAFLCPWFGR